MNHVRNASTHRASLAKMIRKSQISTLIYFLYKKIKMCTYRFWALSAAAAPWGICALIFLGREINQSRTGVRGQKVNQ